MSIARKLQLGFLGTILLTATIAGLGIYHLGELKEDAARAEGCRRNGLKLREAQLRILAQTGAARDYLRERQPDALTTFYSEGSLGRLTVSRVLTHALDEVDATQVRRLAQRLKGFDLAWRRRLEAVEAQPLDPAALRQALLGLGQDAQALRTMTEAIIDGYESRVQDELRMVERDAKTAYAYLWMDTVLALAVCAVIAYVISRQITRPVRQLVDVTLAVGQGDLTQRAQVTSQDELGQLAAAFNVMVEQLQRSRDEVREYSRSLEHKVEERTGELQRSEERYRSLMENAGDAIFITNPLTGAFIEANRNACILTGYSREELATMTSSDVLAHGGEPGAAGHVPQGDTIRRRDGSFVAVDIRTTEIQYGDERVLCSIVRDVSEQQELERQIIQADKMSSLGQLAGGVAHELNNPLGGILMNVNLVMETLDPESEGAADLKRIEGDALRCKGIIENLLDFSRQPNMARKQVDVNDVARRTVALLHHEAELRHVAIECEYADADTVIAADPIQIQQVLVNLIINALHALEAGGRVRVSTLREKGSVVIAVADNGPGIPPHIQGKIFDPFFTTKDTGTGLGLSICYGIIEKHEGSIRVTSRTQAQADAAGRGQEPGTTFEVRLPALHAGS